MIVIRGRAPLERYSGQLQVAQDTKVSGLFDMLCIPPDLRQAILAIKDGKIVQHGDIVQDGSSVELIIMPEGG